MSDQVLWSPTEVWCVKRKQAKKLRVKNGAFLTWCLQKTGQEKPIAEAVCHKQEEDSRTSVGKEFSWEEGATPIREGLSGAGIAGRDGETGSQGCCKRLPGTHGTALLLEAELSSKR